MKEKCNSADLSNISSWTNCCWTQNEGQKTYIHILRLPTTVILIKELAFWEGGKEQNLDCGAQIRVTRDFARAEGFHILSKSGLESGLTFAVSEKMINLHYIFYL